MELFFSFLALLFLEIILGIDNVIFISLITNGVKQEFRKRARYIGLALSVVFRLLMLWFLVFLLHLSKPLFELFGNEFSIKDIILIAGGLFLLAKSTTSIHDESVPKHTKGSAVKHSMFGAIIQIIIVDFVFSLDSLITAIGLTTHILTIGLAIMISIIFMIFFANIISNLIEKHKSLKMLALTFIMMIGIFLVLEGLSIHVNKGYIYFAMGFSLAVETLNIYVRRSSEKKHSK